MLMKSRRSLVSHDPCPKQRLVQTFWPMCLSMRWAEVTMLCVSRVHLTTLTCGRYESLKVGLSNGIIPLGRSHHFVQNCPNAPGEHKWPHWTRTWILPNVFSQSHIIWGLGHAWPKACPTTFTITAFFKGRKSVKYYAEVTGLNPESLEKDTTVCLHSGAFVPEQQPGCKPIWRELRNFPPRRFPDRFSHCCVSLMWHARPATRIWKVEDDWTLVAADSDTIWSTAAF